MSRSFSGLGTIPICWKKHKESITRPLREFWSRLSKPLDFHCSCVWLLGVLLGAFSSVGGGLSSAMQKHFPTLAECSV